MTEMKKEAKEIYVGEKLGEQRHVWFQKICIYLADAFVYPVIGEDVTLEPKYGKAGITYCTERQDGTIEVVKAKCRMNLDETYTTLVVDVPYVKSLRDAVKDKEIEYGGKRKVKGTLMFPSTKEHKIYVIDVNKIDDSIPTRINTVKDTYTETTKTHDAPQYYIDKSMFDVYYIPDYIIFYKDEKDREMQRKKYYTHTSRALF